ncbi:hypothetical protein [Salinibacterium xinjiangense]|nr:hypothetical protein [Salinibacterium xinjiangense]
MTSGRFTVSALLEPASGFSFNVGDSGGPANRRGGFGDHGGSSDGGGGD